MTKDRKRGRSRYNLRTTIKYYFDREDPSFSFFFGIENVQNDEASYWDKMGRGDNKTPLPIVQMFVSDPKKNALI